MVKARYTTPISIAMHPYLESIYTSRIFLSDWRYVFLCMVDKCSAAFQLLLMLCSLAGIAQQCVGHSWGYSEDAWHDQGERRLLGVCNDWFICQHVHLLTCDISPPAIYRTVFLITITIAERADIQQLIHSFVWLSPIIWRTLTNWSAVSLDDLLVHYSFVVECKVLIWGCWPFPFVLSDSGSVGSPDPGGLPDLEREECSSKWVPQPALPGQYICADIHTVYIYKHMKTPTQLYKSEQHCCHLLVYSFKV